MTRGNCNVTANNQVFLLKGEQALEGAPQTQVVPGQNCIPQHYLSFSHTLTTVEEIIWDVEYNERFPIFVAQEDNTIYLQVGIVGPDNYKRQNKEKLVYGRKWRVEPNLPTSEIIQTAFLALKTAREHEIRELFIIDADEHKTTPFNNHHDIPLLARCQSALEQNSVEFVSLDCLQPIIAQIDYAGCGFSVKNLYEIDADNLILTLDVVNTDKTSLPELKTLSQVVLHLTSKRINQVLYCLMQKLVALSDAHVTEHFKYRNFARFSWNNQITAIADISAKTRQLHNQIAQDDFVRSWLAQNNDVDYSRAPALNDSKLGNKLHQQLSAMMPLDGHLPGLLNRSN